MSAQVRMIAGVLAVLAAVAGFWMLLLSPKRAELGAVGDSIVQAEKRRDSARSALAVAERARAQYRSDYATVARLGKAVPADDDVASLVYQLESIARRHRIDFRAVKLTASSTTAPNEAPAPSPDGGGEGEGKDAGDKPEPGSEQESGGDEAAAPAVVQPPPGAVVGSAGLLTVPFTFTFDGGYLQMQRFLRSINGLANRAGERISVRGRLLTVDGFSLARGREGFPKVKATVSATAYIVPKADDAAADATPAAPAGAAASKRGTALTTSDEGAGR